MCQSSLEEVAVPKQASRPWWELFWDPWRFSELPLPPLPMVQWLGPWPLSQGKKHTSCLPLFSLSFWELVFTVYGDLVVGLAPFLLFCFTKLVFGSLVGIRGLVMSYLSEVQPCIHCVKITICPSSVFFLPSLSVNIYCEVEMDRCPVAHKYSYTFYLFNSADFDLFSLCLLESLYSCNRGL